MVWSKSTAKAFYWDILLKTRKVKTIKSRRRCLIVNMSILVFFILSFAGLQKINNRIFDKEISFVKFNMYHYNLHYPLNKNMREKIDFIKSCPFSAKEYVLQLFDKYDIVIIGERSHAEMTQWDLFYDIVSDERFIENVGNIFTEVGACSEYQYLADEYFTTKYKDEDTLDKATARLLQRNGIIQFWNNTNIFNFFKKVNKLNQTVPDSLKLREYFTDQVNAFGNDVQTPEDYNKKITSLHRDSLMADLVIKEFKKIKNEKRKKCLVITNYRHSFNYSGTENGDSFRDEASFIFHAFPNSTANVLVHKQALSYPLISFPIQHGSWDKAFDICGNPSVGFDFRDTPFGKDYFDLFPDLGKKDTLCYQDIYTGYIFYRSLLDCYNQTGFPHAMNDFADEYKRRCYLRFGDSTKIQISPTTGTYSRVTRVSDYPAYYLVYNYEIITFVIFMLLAFISGCLAIIYRSAMERKL
jgi:hypothetical protein